MNDDERTDKKSNRNTRIVILAFVVTILLAIISMVWFVFETVHR